MKICKYIVWLCLHLCTCWRLSWVLPMKSTSWQSLLLKERSWQLKQWWHHLVFHLSLTKLVMWWGKRTKSVLHIQTFSFPINPVAFVIVLLRLSTLWLRQPASSTCMTILEMRGFCWKSDILMENALWKTMLAGFHACIILIYALHDVVI